MAKDIKIDRRWPLAVQLVVSLLMLTIGVTYVFSMFVQRMATKQVGGEYIETSTRAMKLIVNVTLDAIVMEDKEQLGDIIANFGDLNNDVTRVVVTNGDKDVLASWEEPGRAARGEEIHLSLPVALSGRTYGYLAVDWNGATLQHEVERRQSLAQRLIFIMLTSVFASLLLFVHWLVLRPIKYINARLMAVKSGTNDLPAGNWSARELQRLDDTVSLLSEETRRRKSYEEALVLAKDEAMQANVAKSAFLANMSHELRTPLNAIIGYAEILEDACQESGNVGSAADLKQIKLAGHHLLSLINDVLDISKIEVGKVDLKVEAVPVEELIAEIVPLVQPIFEKTETALQIDCAAEIGDVETDPKRLKQILLNLLSNAGKFTNKGKVELKVSEESLDGRRFLSFAVSDTGIGISREQMGRLFKEFSQVDGSATRKFGGTGLGLAISRRLCQLLGGTITVESTPGVGSTFELRIPARLEGHARVVTASKKGSSAEVAVTR